MLALLLAACTPGAIELATDDEPRPDETERLGERDPDPEAIDGHGDTAAPDDTGNAPETWPQACPELYDPGTLQTFELDFDPDDFGDLRRDCQDGAQVYRPVAFTWNGETVDAMARLKGNWSWSCDKMQFVVSFNEEDPGGRFHGVRKLVLDAPWYDRTLLHERLAFPLFRDRGLPHSCVNNARLVVNGQFYGVYVNSERLDEEYLERNFEEPDGDLWQGGAELKTNEDTSDSTRLDALNAARTADELAELADLDQAVAEWATEAMIPALDNYWAGVEINYYLYDHPSRGFTWLPYDLDISYGDAAYESGDLIWPDALRADPLTYEHTGWGKERLVQIVLADPSWCERFVEELALTRAAWDPDAMAAQVDAWSAQIADAVAEDDRKPFSTADHDAAVADLKAFLTDRATFVDAWLAEGGHCPARF